MLLIMNGPSCAVKTNFRTFVKVSRGRDGGMRGRIKGHEAG